MVLYADVDSLTERHGPPTPIMHQHASISNIIGMVILNLEVVNRYRGFKDFMLDFFDNDIITIDERKDITRTKVCRNRPALNGRVERMGGGCNDLFAPAGGAGKQSFFKHF